MAGEYKIRIAGERDLNGLEALEKAAFSTDRFSRDQIEYLLTESRATNFVVEHDSSIVAAACVLWRKSHQGARLYNLAVDPSCQGKGLGLNLLKECELEAARRECHIMSLEVREDNVGGIRFYERYGYRAIRTMRDYYSDGSSGIKMVKSLDIELPLKLKLNVPYYAQTLEFTCGPACLMMTLKYFFPDTELTRAMEMTLWKEATLIFMASGFGGTSGYGIAHSALNRGLSCQMIVSMDSAPLLKSVRNQYKRDVMRVVHNDLKKRARRAGLISATYEYGIDEIIAALHAGIVPVVMISTYRLTGDRVPHWVVVTGFDKNNILIHDPDVASYRKNKSRARHIKVEKSEFLKMTRYGKEVYRCLLLLWK